MIILRNKGEVIDFSESLRHKNLSLGFVPTMGALHDGHLELLKRSIEENQYTLCSIFVNPTQFNNPGDLINYPRTESSDIDKLKKVGCDAVYLPSVEDLYPNGLEIDFLDLNGLDSVMEGVFRPGHFQGVVTVVKRLFLQIFPTTAYFGEKDFQQLQIIRYLVEQERFPIKIIGVPIVRDKSGVALSSRNLLLIPEFKEKAQFIFESLMFVKKVKNEGLSPDEIEQEIINFYENSTFNLEYFTIGEVTTLQKPIIFEPNKNYRAFIVAYAGKVRLIDNMGI